MRTHVPPDLAATVASIAQSLAPNVVRIRYSLEDDWSGNPAIFFRVVLSDDASRRAQLLASSHRVEVEIRIGIDFDAMGRYPYFNYRSKSEQDELRSKKWE